MRINIIMDVDGTDEQQLDWLEEFEATAEEKLNVVFASPGSPGEVEGWFVSVTEVPERQVRGPAKAQP